MSDIRTQTLAFASMFQSAHLVDQLANGIAINEAAFDCCYDSLFTFEANSVSEIYGSGEGLITGLKILVETLNKQQKTNNRVIYYVVSMMKLQSTLLKDSQASLKIQQGFEDIQKQSETFELSSSTTLHKIDALYSDTLSKLKPRIIVQGEQVHLTQPLTTSKIRTLLMSGVRAAVLWKQSGGSWLKFLFTRKQWVKEAQDILAQLQVDQ